MWVTTRGGRERNNKQLSEGRPWQVCPFFTCCALLLLLRLPLPTSFVLCVGASHSSTFQSRPSDSSSGASGCGVCGSAGTTNALGGSPSQRHRAARQQDSRGGTLAGHSPRSSCLDLVDVGIHHCCQVIAGQRENGEGGNARKLCVQEALPAGGRETRRTGNESKRVWKHGDGTENWSMPDAFPDGTFHQGTQ